MAPLRRRPILVVDDEPGLLLLFQRYLARFGYEVEICSNAQQALDRFTRDASRYELVLADLTMPGMSGRDLLEQLVRVNPRVCVLLCSGYPFDPVGLPDGVRRRVRFLQKPFMPAMLMEAIEELLASDEAAPPG